MYASPDHVGRQAAGDGLGGHAGLYRGAGGSGILSTVAEGAGEGHT